MLDLEEYFHLAINASQQKDHHAAMSYLKQALEINPEDARCIFLLAAQHAELGLLERAIEGMERSLEIDPGIEMGWYQLGLLYIQTGRIEKAKPVWNHLRSEARDEAIRLTAEALSIVDEDPKAGIELLSLASKTESSNNFVNESVKTIFDGIDEIVKNLKEPPTKSQDADSTSSIHSAMLSVYNNPKFNKDDN